MNIHIDIGHPAHVHLYRNFAQQMLDKGHKVLITVKDISSAKQLLRYYQLPFIDLPRKADGLVGKVFRQLQFDWKVWRIVQREKIDIGLGTSITNAHVSRVSKMKSVVFDDDDDAVQPLVVKYLHPFAHSLLSPESLLVQGHPRKKKNTLYYPSYHELAYLHPNHFSPNPAVLHELGLTEKDKFFIFRFNVFKAHHDVGESGLSLAQKLELIKILKPHGKIFITTEREIEPELRSYQLITPQEQIHNLLYYATLFIGDSQTMTSEAAVLGTPSIRCNTFVRRIAYLSEQEERYDLTYGFLPIEFNLLRIKLAELLSMSDLKECWQQKRQKLLSEKIDLTAFMVWFVENYPNSHEILKKDPSCPNSFIEKNHFPKTSH